MNHLWNLNRIYRELVEFTVWIPVAKFCLFENDQDLPTPIWQGRTVNLLAGIQ